jgi:hypothetical protein
MKKTYLILISLIILSSVSLVKAAQVEYKAYYQDYCPRENVSFRLYDYRDVHNIWEYTRDGCYFYGTFSNYSGVCRIGSHVGGNISLKSNASWPPSADHIWNADYTFDTGNSTTNFFGINIITTPGPNGLIILVKVSIDSSCTANNITVVRVSDNAIMGSSTNVSGTWFTFTPPIELESNKFYYIVAGSTGFGNYTARYNSSAPSTPINTSDFRVVSFVNTLGNFTSWQDLGNESYNINGIETIGTGPVWGVNYTRSDDYGRVWVDIKRYVNYSNMTEPCGDDECGGSGISFQGCIGPQQYGNRTIVCINNITKSMIYGTPCKTKKCCSCTNYSFWQLGGDLSFYFHNNSLADPKQNFSARNEDCSNECVGNKWYSTYSCAALDTCNVSNLICSEGHCGAQCDQTTDSNLTGSTCSYNCDNTTTCGYQSTCSIDSYCSGNIKYYNGSCSGTGCSFSADDCNTHDGWYNTSSTRWVDIDSCNEKEEIQQEYRDYSCSAATCTYSVTGTQWIETGQTRYKDTTTLCNVAYKCSDSIGGNDKYDAWDFKKPSQGYCDGVGHCDWGITGGTVCTLAEGTTEEGTGKTICQDGYSGCRDTCSDSLDNDIDGCTDNVDSNCGGKDTTCNNIDDNCNGLKDEDYASIACGDAQCSGVTSCVNGGIVCSSWNTECDTKKCCQCNGGSQSYPTENYDASQNNDCNPFDLTGIATCDWVPDNYHPTWDFRNAFDSQCTGLDQCSQGDPNNITHTCDKTQCGAECDSNDDCPSNICKSDCTCEPKTCGLTVTGGSPIAFGSVSTGTTSSAKTVDIKNDGNSPTTDFKVYGIDWSGTGHIMLAGQTGVNDVTWKTLTVSPGITIYTGVISNSETKHPQFNVSIPEGQIQDTYSQNITFTGSC